MIMSMHLLLCQGYSQLSLSCCPSVCLLYVRENSQSFLIQWQGYHKSRTTRKVMDLNQIGNLKSLFCLIDFLYFLAKGNGK